jgi:hypothetical protein
MKPSELVYPAAPFPVERLVVAGGRLSASAHKNPHNPLHMDWSFVIGFHPLEVGDETYETGLSVEIESNDIRRIEQFAGFCRRDTKRDFNIGSFYLFDYRVSHDTDFRVHAVRGTKLDIELQVLVDVGDSYIDPKPPLRKVHARTEVSLESILVSSYGVQSEPDEETLMGIARELFDVSAFRPPTKSEDEYQGKPVLNLSFTPRIEGRD